MLVGFLVIWLITALGLWLVTLMVGGVKADSAGSLLLAALVLGIFNAVIRPILWFLTLPLTVFTFGLFALLINAVMLKLTAAIVPGFEVERFGDAVLAAIIMALLAIVGFIFVQWLMFDTVYWMHMSTGHPMYNI
ncbi:putative membrane protein [Thiogranum longum]|uniref:Putative membrane protein n=1 Tax=Thiogranum longum TaxID=1537524 RepID=A0A4R1H7E6_9GAMM|nr:phage holin family protein [Thiogranum longum]TCK17744.1 putative membrane protein [Thiogranum longum]